jgi:hypothetical protein
MVFTGSPAGTRGQASGVNGTTGDSAGTASSGGSRFEVCGGSDGSLRTHFASLTWVTLHDPVLIGRGSSGPASKWTFSTPVGVAHGDARGGRFQDDGCPVR